MTKQTQSQVILGGVDHTGIPGSELTRVIIGEPKVEVDPTVCHFCGSKLRMDRGGMYLEEVGEFWGEAIQDSVLAHPDCLPLGIDATQAGEDPNWVMA